MSIKVLFVSSEIHPFVKTGGLADISSALPAALQRLDVDIRLLLPGYSQILAGIALTSTHIYLETPGGSVTLLEGVLPSSEVPVYVVGADHLYARPGGPYQNPSGHDWSDNAVRFATLSKVAAILGETSSPLDWKPDIVHVNDWQSGLTAWYLASSAVSSAKVVMTIHNLAYQGCYSRDMMAKLWLPPHAWHHESVEYYGQISFLKAGLAHSSAITTVSPTYAKEIQSEQYGFGMDGLLRHRSDEITGIMNGIDQNIWDPASDPHIAGQYSLQTLDKKSVNKTYLQERLGLREDQDAFLIGVVSRMADQKGLDLFAELIPTLVEEGIQVAVLGSGDRWLEQRFQSFAAQFPDSVATYIGYDEKLAHQMEAGLDAFIMPSRYEPCGLNQLYSMVYGTIPIVRNTGGLADSVIDESTGFVFDEATKESLSRAIKRAHLLFEDQARWQSIQKHAMDINWSWHISARSYLEVYQRLLH